VGPEADPDLSISIEDGPETELTVKGSRFAGQGFRADDEAIGQSRLAAVRRRHHDATHHCWAVRSGDPARPHERWDDDGEPSGSAGVPIFGEIRHADVHQALVVVTRWFGGTKLGTGGLVRAYGEAARLALNAAARREVWRLATLELEISFEQIGPVESLLARQGAAVHAITREFGEGPRFRVVVRWSRAEKLRADLVEATRGRIRVSVSEQGDAPSAH
jgi:uncharacterized YigZ family protein